MIIPDWNIFKSKFSSNPQKYFEWFCYLLFCKQHGCRFIHRYKNQAAIETDLVEADGILVGWQAKFYEGSLSEHKDDLLEMVEMAVKYYPSIKKIQIYTNSEWGQNKGQEPASKIAVEESAKENGIEIEWMVQSYFESEFVVLECEEISKFFFTFENSIIDVVQELKSHTENSLSKISTKITYNDHDLEINREEELQNLIVSESSMIFLMGMGGNGKTAVVKHLYDKISVNNGVLYLIKAHELLGGSKNRLETLDTESFIEYHKLVNKKYFVIDSAEKLHELQDDEVYVNVVSKLIENGWTIVYTIRNHFVEPLSYMVNDIFNIAPLRIEVDSIQSEELESLAKSHNFKIPTSSRLKELIRIPFYLNEFLTNCGENEELNYLGFKKELWIKQIKKGKGERERFFINFAAEKAAQLSFYNESENQYASIFVDEGILAQDESGYFIAHDIYEEWALEKYIGILYKSSTNIEVFLSRIGTSLPLRRAFRNWLGDMLEYDKDIIVAMVDVVCGNIEIEPFWKDEILISILMSSQSEIFFSSIKDQLIDKELFLLRRIAALLITSCNVVDMEYSKALAQKANEPLHLITAPTGEGWKSFIKFVYDNISSIEIENIGFVIKVLHEWVFHNIVGITAKYAGILALQYYEWLQDNRVFHSNKDFEKKILRIIVMSSKEIKAELKVVLDKVIDNKWNHSRDPYNDLCDFILEDMSGNYVAGVLTEELIQIMKLYWTESNEDKYSRLYDDGSSLEHYYGLNKCYYNFYPSSPYKTPVRHILQADINKGLDFCIWFANYTTKHYLESSLCKNEVWTVPIERSDGTIAEIQVSNRLWCVYRGSQTNPDVLGSVYMALEKELLRIGDDLGGEILVPLMMYIIDHTNSAILLGLVVSMVCAYPDQMFEVALRFFSYELYFIFDRNRLSLERSLMFGGTSADRFYIKERQESSKLEHRKVSLEELFTRYAIYYSRKCDEESKARLKELYAILDKHYEELGQDDIQDSINWRMSLGRMDIRKMDIQEARVEEQDCQVYTPVFDDVVESTRLAILEENNKKARFLGLYGWCREKFEEKNISEHNMLYENEVSKVFNEFDQYLNDLQENDESLSLIGRELKYMVPAVMYRDYYSELNDYQIELCEKIIIEGLLSPYQDGFEYNAFNGVRYAYASLPLLAYRDIESVKEVERFIVLALLDEYPIDGVNHFSVYAINALKRIVDHGYVEFVRGLMSKYAAVSVIYNDYLDRCRMMDREEYKPISADKLIYDFSTDCYNEITSAIIESEADDIDLEIIQPVIKAKMFQIMSIIQENDLTEMKHALSQDVLRYYYDAEKNDNSIYSTDGFIKSYCELMLKSDEDDRKKLFAIVGENMVGSDVTCDIARKMIIVEDYLQEREIFWWWMKQLKQMLIAEMDAYTEDTKYLSRRNSKIIRTLMLSENGWNSAAVEWHSLNKMDMLYYKEIAEKLSYHPDVLGSILKLVNGIATVHFKFGISIVADMFRKSNGFEGIGINDDIVQYLEITIRKFVNQHRSEIRRRVNLKSDVITILNWLVKQESVLGYMLRDDLL